MPGVFDIWGSSHQIFHVAILGAFYAHATALTQALTSLRTTDFCAIQAVHSKSTRGGVDMGGLMIIARVEDMITL